MGKSIVVIGAPMPRLDAVSNQTGFHPIERQEQKHG